MTPAGAILAAQLYSALLGYHSQKVGSAYKLENRDEQKARLAVITTAIVETCEAHPIEHLNLRGCAALEATAVKWESGLLRAIHEGTQLGPAGERCLNQLHRTVTQIPNPKWAITHDEWLNSTGLSLAATQRCTTLGVRVLGWHVHRCWRKWSSKKLDEKVEHIFSEYHIPDSAGCMSHVSHMSVMRAESFRELALKLQIVPSAEKIADYETAISGRRDP